MKNEFLSLKIHRPIVYLLIMSALCAGAYFYTIAEIELINTKSNLEVKTNDFEAQITVLLAEKERLMGLLAESNDENEALQEEIDDITNKVTTLEKLKETDKELLAKYSKVYFLNENYKPKDLTEIDEEYLYLKDKPLEIHEEVWPHLERLLRRAKRDGFNLLVISAYRSFGTQESLKAGYKTVYGTSAANSFSADQGYSEHQLGTTVDFTTPKVGGTFTGFDLTPEFKWLQENAYRYGFVLSYPKNNKYYIYEPWHWRFVGEQLADDLHDDNKSFYDLDQREIDEYLLDFFDF